MKLAEIIELSNRLPVCGKYAAIAKGKNELVTTWAGMLRKLKLIWQSRG